jgi:fumarate reductase flavoprotein subunit
VDETATRDLVSKAILTDQHKTAFLVFDAQVVERISLLRGYISEGYVAEATTLSELAGKLGIDTVQTVQTISDYNSLAEKNAADSFGRTRISALRQAPFYAVEVTPANPPPSTPALPTKSSPSPPEPPAKFYSG